MWISDLALTSAKKMIIASQVVNVQMVRENKMDNVLTKKIVTAMMNMEILFWKILKQKHMASAKDVFVNKAELFVPTSQKTAVFIQNGHLGELAVKHVVLAYNIDTENSFQKDPSVKMNILLKIELAQWGGVHLSVSLIILVTMIMIWYEKMLVKFVIANLHHLNVIHNPEQKLMETGQNGLHGVTAVVHVHQGV